MHKNHGRAARCARGFFYKTGQYCKRINAGYRGKIITLSISIDWLGMETVNNSERLSLVEQQRQEALTSVLDKLEELFPRELKATFESHGREYALTSAEDCMVAFAQQHREVVETLYDEIKEQNSYRSEQAVAKLYELFLAYEKTVVLYAELRSYYPTAAGRIDAALPPLSEIAAHGTNAWQKLNQ